jgi:prepilin-type N-terminal cleavage/methylation domain-containing protein
MNITGRSTRGVTMTELLVVLLIIALLGTIAVPVYLSRVKTAGVRTAAVEARQLAEAEEMCAVMHGFFLPLQMLDDVVSIEGVTTNDTYADDIQRDMDDNAVVYYVYKISLPFEQQDNRVVNQEQLRVGDYENDRDLARMYYEWEGPFINYQRFFMGADSYDRPITSPIDSDAYQVLRDFPLDPWGQPYRVFSPMGYTGNDDPAFDTNSTRNTPVEWDQNEDFMTLEIQDRSNDRTDDPYDRWAIVSFGPNQKPDEENEEDNDDIIHSFGFITSETSYDRFPNN